MSRDSEYHNRPEWSYSQLKLILDHGIDYAKGQLEGLIPGPANKAIDLGQLAHMLVLGGEDCFALMEDSGFDSFRTNAAKDWKREQEEAGKIIINKAQWESVCQIVHNIENHPHYKDFIFGDGWEHEVELYATLNGLACRGKADALLRTEHTAIITDLKTTGQFDQFFKRARISHYDLQAAVYSNIVAGTIGIDAGSVDYYFCVAETIAPFRVQFFYATNEFVESGEQKLSYCINQVKENQGKEPNFMLEEIRELGDLSGLMF